MYVDSLGRAVQEHNAKGKGGRNVLETALRRANNNRAYDKVVLLLDTDTDWDDACRAKARRSRIGKRGRLDVIESEPCLEAWLNVLATLAQSQDFDADDPATRAGMNALAQLHLRGELASVVDDTLGTSDAN